MFRKIPETHKHNVKGGGLGSAISAALIGITALTQATISVIQHTNGHQTPTLYKPPQTKEMFVAYESPGYDNITTILS